ncbi:glutaminyl-peptide cyclotransferase [Dokdonia sinensis]|uniref:Glutaminyl-peptide cyclotransferase n=2 Tax=Dokdonia sinensis TaxID=2479847 RepID=A0A3M0G0F1_9FLAO|nr:glutaminyl-peptide cyclotransferase [Dokdonia sinensis]
MNFYKQLAFTLLGTIAISCGDKKNLDTNYTLTTSAEKNSVINGGELMLSIQEKKNYIIDSIVYTLDGNRLASTKKINGFKTKLSSPTLGHKTLQATIYTEEGNATVTEDVVLLNDKAPKVYTYSIINRFPHQTDAYTQGLEFVGDTLYESNGQYGESTLRKLDYKTGEVINEVVLDNQYFAEGLTIHNGNLYQLTWKEDIGFKYDPTTLELKGTFDYGKSRQGWGLTNDGNTIYKSDGTSKIWKLSPNALKEQSYIEPTDNRKVYQKFNELEFINGKIYANTYQKPSIAIIDPVTGALEGIIDLSSLPSEVQEGLDEQNEVLNGIAFKANENRLFVTGKHWNTLFEIEIKEK